MAESKTIIGIDGASKKTGISVIHNGKLRYVLLDYHKISDSNQRITEMTKGITEFIAQYSPAIVWMEDTWTSRNPKVSQMLTTILGGVRYWCSVNNCEFNTILPASWRKYLGMNEHGAKREELKQKSIEYVNEKFGVEVSDDIADAICISIVGNMINEEK